MSGNDEFDIDLTNFEMNQKQRFEDQTDLEDVPPVEGPPWDDARQFEQLYSDEVLWKAWLLIKGNRVEQIDENNDKMWSVSGSQPYIVRIMESEGLPVPWATCSCPNGEARGGRPSCYHTAAVLSVVLGVDLSETPEPVKKKR